MENTPVSNFVIGDRIICNTNHFVTPNGQTINHRVPAFEEVVTIRAFKVFTERGSPFLYLLLNEYTGSYHQNCFNPIAKRIIKRYFKNHKSRS